MTPRTFRATANGSLTARYSPANARPRPDASALAPGDHYVPVAPAQRVSDP